MARVATGRAWDLNIEQSWINTTVGVPTIDPHWRGTDSNGHEHHYDAERHEYPTLDYIIDAQHWCEGDEGLGPHDPHMAVDESHYECKVCRDVVKPGVIPGGTPSSIPGTTNATLTAINTDGVEVTIRATEDEVNQIMERGTDALRNAAARRIVSEAPSERVLSMRRG